MRYSQIKQALREAEIIDEVSMSPTSLEKFANSPEAEGMLMGIEFEMCVPNANTGDDDSYPEPDYDANQSCSSIDEIINFFRSGDYSNMSTREADNLRSEMWDMYLDWSYEAIDRNVDESELDNRIRSRLEDEISREEMADLAHERWIEEHPDEDGTTDKASREILELTQQIFDQTLDNMMEDTSGSEYQYAYDEARQELTDEMREDSDYDQEAWLNDIGVEDMQDAERHWNLDWPYIEYQSGSGDRDVDQIADDFAEGTGFQAKGYNNYHSGSRSAQQEQGYFIIEPDGSIDADEGDAGLEFISPAMPLKDGIEMLKKVQAWAKSEGCYTNKSTGLHMNISVPNMTIETLDYVKLALFLGDEHVLKEFGRQYNSYAKSAMSIVREKIGQNPENASALLAKMKEHLGAAASKLVHSGVTQKYTSINTKDKYVEFRGPGGDYLDQDLPKLVNTALRLAQSLRIATDDGAYKQEYAKKLYKLVSPSEGEWTDPNNSVALFSRYALGQINKEELVSNVRQAQVARKEKKGEEVQYWVMNKDGTGGKQMVFAASETAAILLGGKQLGMNREQSISKLKAELFKQPAVGPAPTKPIPEKLTGGWTDWVNDRAPRADVDDLLRIERDLKDGNFDYLDDESTQYLIDYIGELIEFHKESNTPPESLSQSWRDWVEETLPNVTVEIANSVRQRIINGGDQLSGPASAWIIGQIDAELRNRMDQGVVDGNETRWKVTLDVWENTAYRNVEPVYVDADSPRQAKVKAKEMFQREAGIDVPLNHMEATAVDVIDVGHTEQSWIVLDGFNRPVDTVQARTSDEALHIYGSVNNVDTRNYTAVPGAGNTTSNTDGMSTNSREVFDSLPAGWQGTLTRVGELSGEVLQGYVNHILDVPDNVLSTEQKDFIIQALNTEMRRRRNNDEVAAAAGGAENAVRDSLPEAHRNWLNDIANKSDMDLINVLRSVSTTVTILNDQQTAYFRVMIKRELRRRGISDSERDASEQDNMTSPDDEDINDLMGGDSDDEQSQTNESIKLLRKLAGLK
jgi:hypothetical protein